MLAGDIGSERADETDTSEALDASELSVFDLALLMVARSAGGGGGTESIMIWHLRKASWKYSLREDSSRGTEVYEVGPRAWRAECRVAIVLYVRDKAREPATSSGG